MLPCRGLYLLRAVLFLAAVLVPTLTAAQSTGNLSVSAMACTDLVNLELPDTTITLAEEVPAGPFRFGDMAPTCASPVVSPELPNFCRVVGVVDPAITFELWLPRPEDWNGNFQGYGNHGFAGIIAYSDMGPELVKGYAIASTDTGHAGSDPLPWMQDEQLIIDYGYRGIHEMTVQSKAIVQAFYGEPAEYSYFNGCSTGGKQGLTEAQRYPADYDGIASGDPNFAQIHNRAHYVYNGQVTIADARTRLVPDTLRLVNQAALAACDGDDGVRDGVIDNPATCAFEPDSLLCGPGQDPTTCLTAAQVGAVEQVYAGPKNSRTGESVYPGLVKGTELGWAGQTAGSGIFATADQFFKFMVFKDPNWDYTTFDFDTDLGYADENFSHLVDAIDPNLSAFRDQGGKLLHYHNDSSTVHSSPRSIEYYLDVAESLYGGGDPAFERMQDFYRLFMVPGGNGSKGPDAFDPMPYLERWVEEGIPPDRITAANITEDVVDRTRPLCPYPQVAVYNGSGSTDVAENFTCRINR